MENHNNLILKIYRLLSSSCHLRTLSDVADHCSISVPKTNESMSMVSDENDHSSFLKKPKILGNLLNQLSVSKHGFSDAEGRKCPPVTPVSMADSLKEFQQQRKKNVVCNQQSSSSNSAGWFSSGDEKDGFFSLSSCSGDSNRRKTCRGIIRCEEMKSIDERSSFRSLSSSKSNTVINYGVVLPPAPPKTRRKSARKTAVKKTHDPETSELGFDHYMSTHLNYYDDGQDFISSGRRRETRKPRRKAASKGGWMMEESLAVEKKSRDPRGDFRKSMVDMILEKQLFGAQDLEKLLSCFLDLNAVRYHGIIFEVFSEICEALFSYY
ncbi:uncharacterized protein [Henckelia pumila]|uniref:uncharacterized protein n=1 Tax=Henckelia pumila TaxID=405737 RepID=UPI003C6E9582